VLADAALGSAQFVNSKWSGGKVVATKLQIVEVEVQRVTQPDLLARIDLLRARTAELAEKLDDAISRASAAMEGFRARGRLRAEINAGLYLVRLRKRRATADDLTAIPEMLRSGRTRAAAGLGETDEAVRWIDAHAASWAWARGELSEAHAVFDRLRRLLPSDPAQKITGVVVGPGGKPLAGAAVTAATWLVGDSLRAAAIYNEETDEERTTTTDPDGRFEIADAAENSIVIAQLGDLRSAPAKGGNDVKLVLRPTSRLEGHVDLAGQPAVNVTVAVDDLGQHASINYGLAAPVAADGSFVIDGVPRSEVRVFAGDVRAFDHRTADGVPRSEVRGFAGDVRAFDRRTVAGTKIVVRGPVVRGIALSLAKSTRVVHVIMRSTLHTKLANTLVMVLQGKVASTTLRAIDQARRRYSLSLSGRMARQFESESAEAPTQIVAAARAGDLFATIPDIPEGVASVCAYCLPDQSDEEDWRKLQDHIDEVQVICAQVPEQGDVVTLEVPPLPRLD
jgi:hypothetical protein